MVKKHNLTIDDIARELGVSKTTVSRAMSGKGRISDATRKRINEYVQTHNYRPSAAARALAESRTYNLALVLPKSFIQLDLPYIRQSMNAICEEAFLWDYSIVICLSTEAYPDSLLRTLDNRKVDGVILSRTVENDALVDILTQQCIPFATLGSLPASATGQATVEADHDQVGGCCAFSKSFLQGSREAAALLGNDMHYIVNQSRLTGFNRAAAELSFPEEKLYRISGLGKATQCVNAVRSLLDKGVRRFLCMDDEICLHTLKALLEAGLSIPGDVQVASLCDSEKLASSPVPISALHFDAAELGQIACRELLRCLRDETYDPKPVLGYRILSRGSTL